MSQTFEIAIGLHTHKIEVATDHATGKTSIRVDGRAAARPMNRDEDSREIAVGDKRYNVNRAGGDKFEMEFVGLAAGAEEDGRSGWLANLSISPGRIMLMLAIAVVVIVAYGFARDALGLGWYRFTAPDKSFSFQMPVKPGIVDESVPFHSRPLHLDEYKALRGDREYVVGYADLPAMVPLDKRYAVTDEIRDGILARSHARILRTEDHEWGSVFIARSDEQKRDIKLWVRFQHNRIYVIRAATSLDDLGSSAVMRFFATFEAPEEG